MNAATGPLDQAKPDVECSDGRARRLRVFMMDLWATVPYYTAYLSRALRNAGSDVTIGSITYYLDPGCFRNRGLKTNPGLIDVVGRYPLPQFPRRILKMTEALLNQMALGLRFLFSPPDVIHVQYLPMLKWRLPFEMWFLRYCRARGCAIVLTVHDLLPHDTGERLKDVYQALYRFADRLICHSAKIQSDLEREYAIPARRITVIPHGPFFFDCPMGDTESIGAALDIPQDAPVALWQGIIFPYKGIDLLLNAWQLVEAADPKAYLVIAGTGAVDILEAIRGQVRDLGLARVRLQFKFVSESELVALYRRAGVVIYPYRAITTSGALATGLALGKAIVASDLAVFREILTENETALFVNPHQACALADAVARILGSAPLRLRMERGVREMHYGEESWVEIARQTQKVYSQAAIETGTDAGDGAIPPINQTVTKRRAA